MLSTLSVASGITQSLPTPPTPAPTPAPTPPASTDSVGLSTAAKLADREDANQALGQGWGKIADPDAPFGEGIGVATFDVQQWSRDNVANSTVDGILTSNGVDLSTEEGQRLKQQVASLNNLDDNYTLQAGQELKIPDLEPAPASSDKPPRELSADELKAMPAEQRNQLATEALDQSNQAWNRAQKGFGSLSEDQKVEAGKFVGQKLSDFQASDELAGALQSIQSQNGFSGDQMSNWRTELNEMAKLSFMGEWAEQQIAGGSNLTGLTDMSQGATGYVSHRADFLNLAPNLAGMGF